MTPTQLSSTIVSFGSQSHQFSSEETQNQSSLLQLPSEVLVHIGTFLSKNDYVQFLLSCKKAHNTVVNSPESYKIQFPTVYRISPSRETIVLHTTLVALSTFQKQYYQGHQFIQNALKLDDALFQACQLRALTQLYPDIVLKNFNHIAEKTPALALSLAKDATPQNAHEALDVLKLLNNEAQRVELAMIIAQHKPAFLVTGSTWKHTQITSSEGVKKVIQAVIATGNNQKIETITKSFFIFTPFLNEESCNAIINEIKERAPLLIWNNAPHPAILPRVPSEATRRLAKILF